MDTTQNVLIFQKEIPAWSKGLPAVGWAKAKEGTFKYFELMKNQGGLYTAIKPYFAAIPTAEDEVKLACCLSLFIANLMEWQSDVTLRRLAFGIFIQNLALSSNPTADVKSEFYLQHPKKGAFMLDELGVHDEGLKQIIHQHHEHYDGSGFPNRFSAGRIYGLAKLVTFTSELASVMVGHSCSCVEGLRALLAMEGHATRYDPEYVRVFLGGLVKR